MDKKIQQDNMCLGIVFAKVRFSLVNYFHGYVYAVR